MTSPTSIVETARQILEEQEPNFLRLYLNPHVAQVGFCLDRYVRTTWTQASDRSGKPPRGESAELYQSFLANSLEEALGGAIKLARFVRTPSEQNATGLVVDPTDRLAHFVETRLAGGERVEFLPGIHRVDVSRPNRDRPTGLDSAPVGLLVLVALEGNDFALESDEIRRIVVQHHPRIVTCIDRATLSRLRSGQGGILAEVVPDLVVFDESFVGHEVPFAAFTARQSLFGAWNRPGKSTFHSTTFQPNTLSTRHFMNRLAEDDPGFTSQYAPELTAIRNDARTRGQAFRNHYNPSLYRLIRAAGFESGDVRASGSFVVVNGQPVFDVVGGVACSMVGHNPPSYAEAMASMADVDGTTAKDRLAQRLGELTGLTAILPAVSGASAVENALRLALVARFPRRHILALKAGFGGKTLLSLAATEKPFYKENIGPLHAEVHYVDPFAPDAIHQINVLMEQHEFAAVQVELIQSVGGVRRLPHDLVRHLDESRSRWDYLFIVDEVQTGMYRTGPFCQSQTFGIRPDILLLGKGTSNMMFPFALTLFSDEVRARVDASGSRMREAIESRYGYEVGYKTVLDVLETAERLDLPAQVARAGACVERRLAQGAVPARGIRDIRVFGLLIAVELDTRSGPRRWFRKRLGPLYLLALLRHERFPVLAGFCQYEPNTLKITPPLNADLGDLERACDTLLEILGRPLRQVVSSAIAQLLRPRPLRKAPHEHRDHPALELSPR